MNYTPLSFICIDCCVMQFLCLNQMSFFLDSEYRDHTCFFMHLHLPVLRKLFEHEAVRQSVQTSSEVLGKCYCNETNMSDRYTCIFYLIST